jgi:DNA-directed RNA polymerase specialized sigma subunit
MKSYIVTATRVHSLWELDVPGIGITQSTTAGAAEEMVRDYLECLGVAEADTVPISIDWHIAPEIDARIADARANAAKAAQLQARASNINRETVILLKSEGMTGRDIAAVLGISEQRVSQLAKAAGKAA